MPTDSISVAQIDRISWMVGLEPTDGYAQRNKRPEPALSTESFETIPT
jgi:hypothetical protein